MQCQHANQTYFKVCNGVNKIKMYYCFYTDYIIGNNRTVDKYRKSYLVFNLFSLLQSGFGHQSTETALLVVLNHMRLNNDASRSFSDLGDTDPDPDPDQVFIYTQLHIRLQLLFLQCHIAATPVSKEEQLKTKMDVDWSF